MKRKDLNCSKNVNIYKFHIKCETSHTQSKCLTKSFNIIETPCYQLCTQLSYTKIRRIPNDLCWYCLHRYYLLLCLTTFIIIKDNKQDKELPRPTFIVWTLRRVNLILVKDTRLCLGSGRMSNLVCKQTIIDTWKT